MEFAVKYNIIFCVKYKDSIVDAEREHKISWQVYL